MEYINVKFVAPLLSLSSLVASGRCDLDAWLKWESEFRPAIGDDGISIVNKLVQKAQDKYPNRFVFSIKEIGWKPGATTPIATIYPKIDAIVWSWS